MTINIYLAILLTIGISINEAQCDDCFMSGDATGRSTRCGANSNDEENLNDPVEIMKRTREFLEKQSRKMLDPMSWTIRPPPPPPPAAAAAALMLPTLPPSLSINPAAAAVTLPTTIPQQPTFVVPAAGIGTNLQSSYIPLNSVRLPYNANSFFTPPSQLEKSEVVYNQQLLPFDRIIPSKDSQSYYQKIIFVTNQTYIPILPEDPEQINVAAKGEEEEEELQNYLIDEINETPRLLKLPPAPLLSKISIQKHNPKLNEDNNNDDFKSKISNSTPIRLLLERPVVTLPSQLTYEP